MDVPLPNETTMAPRPSVVTLPALPLPYPAIIDFLIARFPHVPETTWRNRLTSGKITDPEGTPITPATPYRPHMQLRYYRETFREPAIPFQESILHQDDHLIVACKPHFLPVTPGGPYVNECLLYRLIRHTGIRTLTPIHRLDKDTAGVILFSADPQTRGTYQTLFDTGQVRKTYEAIARHPVSPETLRTTVRGRIEKGTPFFRMRETSGPVNAETVFTLTNTHGDQARYRVTPITGKKHQIRLHMCRVAQGIVNDRFYPTLQPEGEPDFNTPLKLISRRISFTDPLLKKSRDFTTPRPLPWA